MLLPTLLRNKIIWILTYILLVLGISFVFELPFLADVQAAPIFLSLFTLV